MPRYTYTAVNAEGKTFKGVAAAESEEGLYALLKLEGKFLTSAQAGGEYRRSRPLKSRQLAEFCRQVGNLTDAGVTLVRALGVIGQDEGLRASERQLFVRILTSVKSGDSLSTAMDSIGGAFPPLMVGMFRSAESSGGLGKTALRLSTHYDKQHRLESKIRSATAYPKLLAVMMLGVVLIIMGYVLPQFQSFFDMMDELPVMTRFLMGFSDLVTQKWYYVLMAVLALVILWRAIWMLPALRNGWDRLKLKLPVVGPLLKTICTARFARTFSSLYSSGMPIITSLQMARDTVGNRYIEGQFADAIAYIKGGGTLSDGLDRIDGFSGKMRAAVRVGEETGRLDSMLESTAEVMEYESEAAIARLVALIEPAMIILMAGLVALVIIGVIKPIYGSYDALAGYG